jgi:hypothetical protein
MVDVADRNSPLPRPLLPYHPRRWAPHSVKTVREPYLPIEGYFEPSYVDISACTTIYLSYRHYGGLCGIFSEIREGCEEVSLGSIPQARTVRMFGLRRLSIPGGNVALLQVRYY